MILKYCKRCFELRVLIQIIVEIMLQIDQCIPILMDDSV